VIKSTGGQQAPGISLSQRTFGTQLDANTSDVSNFSHPCSCPRHVYIHTSRSRHGHLLLVAPPSNAALLGAALIKVLES
jgi:hypothetical protein